jgi:hypothetical protein
VTSKRLTWYRISVTSIVRKKENKLHPKERKSMGIRVQKERNQVCESSLMAKNER